MAAHNSGGIVIVQVERIVDRGTLPTRHSHIPGAMVDKVVVAPPEQHWQSLANPQYDGSLSGEHSWKSCCFMCDHYHHSTIASKD